jgi:2-polyprenyl-3-methyl-5-hydroxy-6-metoxy-1,4-benzoquinol methylase
MDISACPVATKVEGLFHELYPYFSGALKRQHETFGDSWLEFFEHDLNKFFNDDDERIKGAIKGYGAFALDSMKLQVLFQKTKEYVNKTYAEAADEVYQNKEYMFKLYLPGIYLSHFLWNHHYCQHVFFMNKFLPMMQKHGGKKFYDIGVGTGFYSKEMLRYDSEMQGEGFDLSPHSLEHTGMMLEQWKMNDRYTLNLRNIITEPIEKPAPFIMNIEVLEHLEDPQEFLNALVKMLESGGLGMISAAINAPNADHIYLYRNPEEVKQQIETAGFTIVDYIADAAYIPRKPDDIVPVNAAFIVTRS